MLESMPQSSIRSYVLRQGRMTMGQKRAVAELFSQYGIASNQENIAKHPWFCQKKPLGIEIGFGMGDSLLQMAEQHPHKNFIGIDVHAPGIGHLLLQIEQKGLTNIRVMHDDVAHVLPLCPQQCFDTAYVLFPDPWPKKRQQKRRLIQANFIKLLVSRMQNSAMIYMATDSDDYAQQMRSLLNHGSSLMDLGENGFLALKSHRPATKYELRAKRLGHRIWDLGYRVSH